MGIIIRQSIKGSFWSYLGLVLGYINLGIIMPQVMETDQIGLIQLFAAISILFSQFATLGFTSVINRMFPVFRNRAKGNNGFLFLALATGMLGFLLSIVAFILLKPHIIETNLERSPLIVEYLGLLLPLVFFRIFFILLDNYNKVLLDSVTGTFWNEFIHKLLNLLLVILFALSWINFRQFFFGYIVSLSLPALPLVFVLVKRSQFSLRPDLTFLKKPLVREIAIISAFGLINGFSGILTTNVDKIFINQYLSLDQVGIFGVCALFATVINIPSRAIQKISTGIIAQSWKEENKNHIQEIYAKASINQTIMGAFILIMLLVNLTNVFRILPETYSQGKWVLIIYSIGVLINVSNTNGGAIIQTSKHYKALTYIIILQIGVAVLLNMILIPRYAITGAAMAVLFTFLFRTLAIIGFLKIKTGLFCYSMKHVLVAGLTLAIITADLFMPELDRLIPNIIVKSSMVGLLYLFLIFTFKISDDITLLFTQIYHRIIRFLRNR
jgi:O-antigen/teichoic acid export membrane protein